MIGVVRHLEDHAQAWQRRQQLGERRCETGVHDDRGSTRVPQEVQQFIRDVAVVHVERGDPRLQGTEHALEVFVAVVEVDRQVVLTGLVSLESRSFDPAAEPLDDEVVGEPARPVGHVSPREPPIAEHQALVVGTCGRDRLVDVGEAQPNGP